MITAKPPKELKLLHREGTQDRYVYDEVLAANAYRLPERFTDADLILDVGAHIGYFTTACLLRGAGAVWCFEPDADNFAYLKKNLLRFADRVRLHDCAVWHQTEKRPFSGYPEGLSACGTVLRGVGPCGHNEGRPVPAVAFADILRRATGDGACRVRLVKLDCEGAEFPILYGTPDLSMIDELVAEVHPFRGNALEYNRVEGFADYTLAGLAGHLACQSFDVETLPGTPRNQNEMLFAGRPGVK